MVTSPPDITACPPKTDAMSITNTGVAPSRALLPTLPRDPPLPAPNNHDVRLDGQESPPAPRNGRPVQW